MRGVIRAGANISLPPGTIEVIDDAGAFGRVITGNHRNDTFTDTYAFDLPLAATSLTANLYSNAGNANVGLNITGFSCTRATARW